MGSYDGSPLYFDDGSTVTPNPSVPNTSTASSAADLSQMGSTMAQWGATIASLVTNAPPVTTASGQRIASVNAPAPAMSSTTILIVLALGVVVLLVVMKKV